MEEKQQMSNLEMKVVQNLIKEVRNKAKDLFFEALTCTKDFRSEEFDTYLMKIAVITQELNYYKTRLDTMLKPETEKQKALKILNLIGDK